MVSDGRTSDTRSSSYGVVAYIDPQIDRKVKPLSKCLGNRCYLFGDHYNQKSTLEGSSGAGACPVASPAQASAHGISSATHSRVAWAAGGRVLVAQKEPEPTLSEDNPLTVLRIHFP